ncbi:MAG: hypothetical protein P1V97_20165 [Planctomycetota bacterium]|nr:hypothetical protein [Planctomycetota bacterium]
MKINCKCGRVLKVTKELAGKKIKCKTCGQKYKLPAEKPSDPTIQMKAWKNEGKDDESAPAQNPADVGAVALGETFSFGWVVASIFITLISSVLGIFIAKYIMTALATEEKIQEYSDYIQYGMYWGPSLAFVASGWIVARFSPGRTISEPAIGAVIESMLELKAGAVKTLGSGNLPLKLNLCLLAMFNAACLACAGAYFGEVAQERTAI